jgi:hypothetical protein
MTSPIETNPCSCWFGPCSIHSGHCCFRTSEECHPIPKEIIQETTADQVETWENEGGRPAPKPSPLSPLEWAMIEEFWTLQAEADQEPAEYRREVA